MKRVVRIKIKVKIKCRRIIENICHVVEIYIEEERG